PKKWCGGKRQANTGSAGALARNEREARNSYSVKGLRLSVLRARAPALPVITGSFQIGSTFWAKPRRRKNQRGCLRQSGRLPLISLLPHCPRCEESKSQTYPGSLPVMLFDLF